MRSNALANAARGDEVRHGFRTAGISLILTASLLLPGLTEAQNSLGLADLAAQPGSTISATLQVTNDVPLEGFSCGVSYDPAMLTLVNVLPGAILDSTQGGTDPDVFLVQTDPGGAAGVTVACLMTLGPPPFTVIPVGNDQPAVEIQFLTSNTAGTTALTFSSTLGSPPVEVLMVSDAIGLTPTTSPGSVTIANIFYRGDCNLDGNVDLADPVCLLRILFLADPIICADAHDTDDSGDLDIFDAVVLLNYLFLGGATPPVPNPETGCGVDPTPDTLDCGTFGVCP